MRWVVFGAELPAPGTCLLGTRVGVVARVRLQVVEMERFGAWVGQLTTRGPPFDGRLDVSGLVWDRSAAKADNGHKGLMPVVTPTKSGHN